MIYTIYKTDDMYNIIILLIFEVYRIYNNKSTNNLKLKRIFYKHRVNKMFINQ